MGQHARLGPSNHKWVNCPGSLREEANYPDVPGVAAIDGTGSHLLLETCLNENLLPQFYIGKTIGEGHEDRPQGWLVKQDRIDRVQTCIDYVERRKKELMKEFPGSMIILEVETRSNPGILYGRDDWWGTVDITILVSDSCDYLFTEVIDYKDGQSYVDCKNNPQLTAYLGGKCSIFSSNNVEIITRMTIVQPKSHTPIRYEDISPRELHTRVEYLAERASHTDSPNAPLIPDDKGGKGYCKWCKHNKNCKAIVNKTIGELKVIKDKDGNTLDSFEQFKTMFEDIDTIDADLLSHFLDTRKSIDKIYDRASEEVERRLTSGDVIPGYKMLPGNSKKKWKITEEELYKLLSARKLKKDEIYISKLISPAAVLSHDTLTKKQKDKLSESIEVIPGALSLRSVERKKKTALDMFSDVALQCNTDEEVSFI